MSTRELVLSGVEQSINSLLKMDPAARNRLARHHGRVIALHLRGLELTLYFVPGHDGLLQLLGSIEGEPDCTLSGSPLDLLRSGDKETGAGQLFAGHVSITGDTGLAHTFGATLANLDIDWEEQLSRFTGDLVAHQVGRGTRGLASYLAQSKQTLESNLAEYLTEEARLLPHPYEVEEFLDEVDRLKDDTERLLARFARLQQETAQGQSK